MSGLGTVAIPAQEPRDGLAVETFRGTHRSREIFLEGPGSRQIPRREGPKLLPVGQP